MKKHLKGVSLVLLMLLLMELIASFIPFLDFSVSKAAPGFGNASIQPYTDPNYPTRRYAVGFMYYEAWTNSAGQWTTYSPGQTVKADDLYHTYNFNFPARSVTDVKVYKFDSSNSKHTEYFNESRRGDLDFKEYEKFLSASISNPTVSNLSGQGSSTVTFKVNLSGQLTTGRHKDMREKESDDPCPSCSPGVKIYRYYFPVVFEFYLNGQQIVQHYTTSGQSLADVFPTKTTDMSIGQTYSVEPPTKSGYTYAGYKSSTTGVPDGAIKSGTPPSIKFDGSYDTHRINLYYENGAKAVIKHFLENGSSLNSVFTDKEQALVKDKNYSFEAPTNANYEYVGFKISTNGEPPANLNNPSNYTYKLDPFQGNFSLMYLYHVYRLKAGANTGEIKIRHMVRTSPTGSYSLADESSEIVSTLPATRTITANSTYGTVQGYNVDYSTYKNTVNNGSSASVSLSTANKTAYVSFFYEKNTASYKADFRIVPGSIEYRDNFSFIPDITVNGCTYYSHRYRIMRDGSSVVTSPVYGINTHSNYTYSTYPWVIGVGTHNVYIEVTTSCGTSDWIGPKLLDVKGPKDNRPPEFEIGFVYPWAWTKPIKKVVVGTTMDLIYIDDPSVPTPMDPDGDKVYFMGFDFSISSDWGQRIPVKYDKQINGYHSIKMDTLGTHYVRAYMRDDFGAVSVRTTSIEVVPREPVAMITGPSTVVEGRPLPQTFSSANSFSPTDRKINHSRDIWTNKLSIYDKPGEEIITLHVYDEDGLRSIYPATHTLTVKEDLPPVPQLDYRTPMIRLGQGKDATFKVTSYSPDNDKIVLEKVSYVYDLGNKGLFGSQPEIEVKLNANREFIIPKLQVGKYKITVYAKEDWGKDASRTFDLHVINDRPLVSFDVSSEYIEPVVIKDVPILTSDIIKNFKNTDYYGETPMSWAVNPRTKALANIDYLNVRASNYVGPTPLNVKIIQIAEDGAYLFNDYSVSKRNGNLNVFKGQIVQTYKGYSDDSLMRINYWRQELETMSYNRDFYRVYKFTEFIKPSGQEKFSQNPTQQLSRETSYSYQQEKYTSQWTNDGSMENAEWSEPNRILEKKNFNVNEYQARSASLLDAYGRRYRMYKPFSGDGMFLIYDPRSNETRTVTDTPYHHTVYPSDDGKFIINGDGSIYNTNTGKISGTAGLYKINVDLPPVKNIVVMQHVTLPEKYIIYKWENDGKLKTVATIDDVFWTSNTKVSVYPITKVDAQGYIYYVSKDKKIQRVNTRTGAKQLITTISSDIWPNDSASSGYKYAYAPLISVNYDGLLILRINNYNYYDSMCCGVQESWYTYPYVVYNENPMIKESLLTQQQLVSKLKLSDANFNFTLRMNDIFIAERYAGFGFHIQDEKNMYRVEANDRTLRLVKIVNGQRTELQKTDYNFKERTAYKIKINILDGVIRVYVQNVPLLEATDSEFASGFYGPYTEVSKTEFFDMSYADLSALSAKNKLQGIALVGEEMIYSTMYTDTEEDPSVKALTSWTYKQLDQKFLDASDGKSGVSKYNDKSYTEPITVMDKVGLYQVTYKTTDDPHSDHLYPDNTFADYRQESNLASRQLIVHRPPTVDYDIAAASDGTILWTDRSHDKDRYLTATNYSKEDTGIDYKATKGILEKRFYYVTPSGRTVAAKLVTPEERGLYKVGLAVKDEYDAWSQFLEKTINVTVIPKADEPPVAGFTTSHINTYRGVPITITSTAYDKEDGPSKNLPHWYYIRNESIGGFETLQSTARESWIKTFNSLGTFNIRQVVEDSLGQSDTFQFKVNIVNRKPVARVTVPASEDQSNPTKMTELQPTFRWTYGDADQDTQSKYSVRIYRYGGHMEQESSELTGSALTWKPAKPLPEKVNMYIQVRVHDGIEWGDWSDRRFFFIETNQPPTADFDWAPKPVYEGDTIQISHSLSDPDKDNLTVNYVVTDMVTGAKKTYDYNLSFPYSNAGPGPSWKTTKSGNYEVEQSVSDGKAEAIVTRKTIRVLELDLTAEVSHTDTWLNNLKEYNKKLDQQLRNREITQQQYNQRYRNENDFWAGESFLLSAVTTSIQTGSTVRAEEVWTVVTGSAYPNESQSPWAGKAYLDRDLKPGNTTRTLWNGRVNDPHTDLPNVPADIKLEQLKNGYLDFTFKVRYNNGTEKIKVVRVNIKNKWNDFYQLHRIK
ncbi:hypothetical protein ACFOQM_04070 [Paenibacillus sp. GCM10012307]|uniref:Uncharacterized protein n=1 Tax=Paenibacillus roseus TaxID=2798579 RepID=A0A934MPJ6_9BACL|nr:hypothetical protein [Paenibacillus roseus]MBJ6360489.1 hypothetical protein [Paenibacillus roseus]